MNDQIRVKRPHGFTADAIAGTGALVAKLPGRVPAKLKLMAEADWDAWILLDANSATRADLQNRIMRADAEHAELKYAFDRGEVTRETWNYENRNRNEGSQGTRHIVADQPRLDASSKAIDGLKAELRRVNEKIEARQTVWQSRRASIDALERYLNDLADDAVLTEVVVKAKVNASVADVERMRDRVNAAKADLAATAAAPIPTAEAKAMMRSWVEQLEAGSMPKLYDLAFGVFRIDFPKIDVETMGVGGLPGGGGVTTVRGNARVIDPLALLAWFDKDRLIGMLDKEIDDVGDDTIALDRKTRLEREATLKAKIVDLEREEEALLEMVAASGVEGLLRRADCDVRAVFGIAGPAPRGE